MPRSTSPAPELFRLRRELTEPRSRVATTRHLARLRRKQAEIAQRRAEALAEEAHRLLQAYRPR